jgi:hypothetical protein
MLGINTMMPLNNFILRGRCGDDIIVDVTWVDVVVECFRHKTDKLWFRHVILIQVVKLLWVTAISIVTQSVYCPELLESCGKLVLTELCNFCLARSHVAGYVPFQKCGHNSGCKYIFPTPSKACITRKSVYNFQRNACRQPWEPGWRLSVSILLELLLISEKG